MIFTLFYIIDKILKFLLYGVLFLFIFLIIRVVFKIIEKKSLESYIGSLFSAIVIGIFLFFIGGFTYLKDTYFPKKYIDPRSLPEFWEHRVKPEIALPYFEERCKSAGIFIYEDIPKQEGFYIMPQEFIEAPSHLNEAQKKLGLYEAPVRLNIELNSLNGARYWISNPYKKHAIAANDFGGYYNYLMYTKERKDWHFNYLEGYELVLTNNGNKAKQLFRYSFEKTHDESYRPLYYAEQMKDKNYPNTFYVILKTPIKYPISRYMVAIEDISTKADRDNWVAGGRVRIYDQKTGKIIAEQIGFILSKNGIGKELVDMNSYWEPYKKCPNIERREFLFSIFKKHIKGNG